MTALAQTSLTTITLEQANTIIAGAFAEAKRLNLKPMSVIVLDAGGHEKAFQRADGGSAMRQQIAFGKAWGAIGFGTNSRNLQQMAEQRPVFVNALVDAADGKLIPAAGGVLIHSASGELLGAVGVTGDLPDNDELCAIAGIKAAGLIPYEAK